MQGNSRLELYKNFLEFIVEDIQGERSRVNRKMLSVFLWCFLLPAFISLTVLLMVKLKMFPRSVRNYLDWLVLVFPVLYSLYFLSSEVIARVPAAFKKGGVATALGQSLKEGEWRVRVCDAMERTLGATHEEWGWVIENFKIDLQMMQNRTRYLTALAGAVFFLLMQGIDSLTDGEEKMTFMKTSALGWVEISGGDLSQFVGLTLFLVLLYLSGSQTHQHLQRYLDCAELVYLKPNSSSRR